jgi:hypothetical protein
MFTSYDLIKYVDGSDIWNVEIFDLHNMVQKLALILQSPSTNKFTYYTNSYFTLSWSYMFWLVGILRGLTTK